MDYLFERPIVTVRMVEKHLQCSFATANKLVRRFEGLGLLKQLSPWKSRNRSFWYDSYMALFEEARQPMLQQEGTSQTTVAETAGPSLGKDGK
jgi:hypothetical protein